MLFSDKLMLLKSGSTMGDKVLLRILKHVCVYYYQILHCFELPVLFLLSITKITESPVLVEFSCTLN